jgi:hypothetical protein
MRRHGDTAFLGHPQALLFQADQAMAEQAGITVF